MAELAELQPVSRRQHWPSEIVVIWSELMCFFFGGPTWGATCGWTFIDFAEEPNTHTNTMHPVVIALRIPFHGDRIALIACPRGLWQFDQFCFCLIQSSKTKEKKTFQAHVVNNRHSHVESTWLRWRSRGTQEVLRKCHLMPHAQLPMISSEWLTFVRYSGLLKSQSGATNKYPHFDTLRVAWNEGRCY